MSAMTDKPTEQAFTIPQIKDALETSCLTKLVKPLVLNVFLGHLGSPTTPAPPPAPERAEHPSRRWNVEPTERGYKICRGEHDKGDDCDWEYLVPESAAPQAAAQGEAVHLMGKHDHVPDEVAKFCDARSGYRAGWNECAEYVNARGRPTRPRRSGRAAGGVGEGVGREVGNAIPPSDAQHLPNLRRRTSTRRHRPGAGGGGEGCGGCEAVSVAAE